MRDTLQGNPPPSQNFVDSLSAAPGDPTRLDGGDGGPESQRTMRLSAQGAAAPSPPLAPAFRPANPAERRQLRAGGHARVRFSPRWLRVVFGVALVVGAVALLAGYLPSAAPVSPEEAVKIARAHNTTRAAVMDARLSRELYMVVRLGSFALLGFGVLIAAMGIMSRAEVETRCRACGRDVFALRATFGLRCPACHAYARIHWTILVVTALFWLSVAAMAVVLLVLVS